MTTGKTDRRGLKSRPAQNRLGSLVVLALLVAPAAAIAAEAVAATTVREIVAEYFDEASERISLDTRLVADLGADQLDLLEIVVAIEDALDIAIGYEAVDRDSTVHHLVELVETGSSRLAPAGRAAAGSGEQNRVEKERASTPRRRQGTATRRRPRPRTTPPAPPEPGPTPATPRQAEEAPAEGDASSPRQGGTATRALPRPRPVAPAVAEPETEAGTLPAPEGASPPARLQPPSPPEEMRAAGYDEALEAYYAALREKNRADQATYARLANYDAWALENRKRVIERQQNAALIVLAVVVFLVISGVVFSAIQFYIAMRHAQRGEHAPTTTLKASLSSIEVSSSVLGLIVLVISLLFFYLYLDRVFSLAILPD